MFHSIAADQKPLPTASRALRWAIYCFAAMSLCPGASHADVFRFIIRADPPAIPANGRSTTTISIEINNAQNPSSLSGGIANFVTTMGVIEPTARIVGNTARVTLRSGTIPGMATVTAIVGQSREQLQVEFVADTGAITEATKSVSLKGKNLTYYPSSNLVIASGKSSVRFRHMRLRCDMKLQYDVAKQYIVAEGEPGENAVAFSNGKETLSGDRVKLNLNTLEGTLLKVNPEPSRTYFSVDGEKRGFIERTSPGGSEANGVQPEPKFPEVDDAVGTVVIARQIVVYPHEKIKFKRARIYINGSYVISLPMHVLSLSTQAFESYGIMGDRVFGFNSTGGFGLDFPFYYHITSGGQGALHLRHAGGDGFFTDAPGWTLAVEEEYSFKEDGTGTLEVDKLTRGDWGVQWDHSQEFTPDSQGYFYVSSPQHEDVFGRASLSKEFDNYTVGLETFGDAPRDAYASATAQAYWQTHARSLGKSAMNYATSVEVSYQNNPSAENPEVLSETLQTSVYLPSWKLGDRTAVHSSLQPQVYHDSTGITSAGLGAMLTFRHAFAESTDLSLSYTRSPGTASSFGVLDTQYLSASFLSVPNDRWQFSSSGTFNLTEDSFFGSANATYRINEMWRLGVTSVYQKFTGDSLTDFDVTVGRRLGKLNMEGAIGWSKSRGSLYFQIGSLSL